MLIAIAVPAENERGPRYMEQVLDALHAANRRYSRLELIVGRHAGEVMLFCRVPDRLGQFLQRQLHAAYPDAHILRLDDEALKLPATFRRRRWFLTLRPTLGRLRTWQEYTDKEQHTLASLGLIRRWNVETGEMMRSRSEASVSSTEASCVGNS